jgi:hypothetical protein
MLELDSAAQAAKIAVAQTAIRGRLDSGKLESEERQAIQIALNALKFLAH